MKKAFFTIAFTATLSLLGQAAGADDGHAIYKSKCQACHGAGGSGSPMAPAFKENQFIGTRSVEEISAVIRDGRNAKSSRYDKGRYTIGMPRQSLSNTEIVAVVSYLKTVSGYESFSSDSNRENDGLKEKTETPSKDNAIYIPLKNLLNTDIATKTLKGLGGSVESVAFSPDGKTLASGGVDKIVGLWDLATGKEVKTFKGHTDSIKSIAFSPDGQTLASGSADMTVGLWDVATGGRIKTFEGHSGYVSSIAFSPDGQTLASGSYDNTVGLWNITTGARITTLDGHSGDVESVAFSPDGRTLASGSTDNSIRLWNLASGGRMKTFEGHLGYVWSVVFSPDGRTLATGSAEGTVGLWDVATGVRIKTLEGHDNSVNSVAFSPDGKTLASGSADRTIALRDLSIYSMFSSFKSDVFGTIESERDAKLKELLRSKGEFEKTRDYEERIRAAKASEAAIQREYDERARDARDRAEKELVEKRSKLYPITLKVSLGRYDADNEAFEADIFGDSILINIPVEKAAEISKRKEDILIQGQIRYFDETKAELVNPFLVDTATKERYAFGRHTDAVMTASSRKAPPDLKIASIKLIEPSDNGILDADEKGRLLIVLRNTGTGVATGVSLTLEADKALKGLRLNEKVYLGQINPNEEKSVEVDISGLDDIESADLNLKAKLVESSGFDSQPIIIAFKTKALVPPLLQVAKVDIEDTDGRRVITKGKEAKVTLTVQNAGQGASRDVVVTLRPDDADIRMFGDSTFKIGVLLAGESKKAVFSVAVTSRYNGPKELPLHVIVKEGRERFSVKPDIKFALNEEAPDVRVVKVEARTLPTAKVEDIDDINTPPAFSPEQKIMGDQDVAIVIGVERYRKLPKAEYAYNDAKAVKGYLKAMGFSERNIKFLVDEEATLSGINSSIGTWLPNRTKKESRVFIYYSGHGSPDPATGEAYLMPHDGDPNYLADTGYSLKKLYDSLAKLDAAEVAVVLDSCFSGTGGRSVIAKGARPMVVFVDEGVLASKNLAILSSTQGAQISTSYAEKEHGLFTYYFLKAVKEGKKDIGEIYSYIKPLVEDEARAQNVEQSPSLKPGPEEVKARFGLRR